MGSRDDERTANSLKTQPKAWTNSKRNSHGNKTICYWHFKL
jgi:hypothetical protein